MESMLIVSFYSKITNAELIIRIRCLVTFERKGNVHIFFLTFLKGYTCII